MKVDLNIMIKIFSRANLCRIPLLNFSPLHRFSKSQPNPPESSNQNYLKSRQPVIKTLETLKQIPIPETLTNDKTVMKKLLLLNLFFVCFIPFYPTINTGIGLLNGSFIMSQLGQQLKKLLIIINNKHYEQLSNYKSLAAYSKIIMQNMFFLSAQAALLGYSYYYLAHIFTILWYFLNFYNQSIPTSYYPIVVMLLITILVNIFSKPILGLLEENKKKEAKQTKS